MIINQLQTLKNEYVELYTMTNDEARRKHLKYAIKILNEAIAKINGDRYSVEQLVTEELLSSLYYEDIHRSMAHKIIDELPAEKLRQLFNITESEDTRHYARRLTAELKI